MQADTIESAWADDRVLLADCVTFRDGRMVLLSIEELPTDGVRVRAVGETTVAAFIEHKKERWAHVTATCRLPSSSGDLYVAGEGSYGSDGFIARVASATGELRYSIFLTSSNPFVSLDFNAQETVLTATSNLGARWSLNVNKPWEITVDTPLRC